MGNKDELTEQARKINSAMCGRHKGFIYIFIYATKTFPQGIKTFPQGICQTFFHEQKV